MEPSYNRKFQILSTDGAIFVIGRHQLAVLGTFEFPFSMDRGGCPLGREGSDIA